MQKIGKTYEEQDVYKLDEILSIVENGELIINGKSGFLDFDFTMFIVPNFDNKTFTIEQVKENIINLQAVKVDEYIITTIPIDDENGDDEYSIKNTKTNKKYIFKLEDRFDDENCEEYTEIIFSNILTIKLYDDKDIFYEIFKDEDEYIELIKPLAKAFDYQVTQFENYNEILDLAKSELF